MFDWYSLASDTCMLPPKPEKATEIPALPMVFASAPSETPQKVSHCLLVTLGAGGGGGYASGSVVSVGPGPEAAWSKLTLLLSGVGPVKGRQMGWPKAAVTCDVSPHGVTGVVLP